MMSVFIYRYGRVNVPEPDLVRLSEYMSLHYGLTHFRCLPYSGMLLSDEFTVP